MTSRHQPEVPASAPPAYARPLIPFAVLTVVAILIVAPLIRHGCSCGHDFDFHLLNWLEAAQQFQHGNPHPQWAATPAWNAGEPRFVFYPPLSWTLGALLTLAASSLAAPPLAHLTHLAPANAFAAVPIAYTAIVLFAGGLALFRVARPFAGASAATLAAAAYMANPYALFTSYERTAYAELLSMALFPLLLREMLPPANPARINLAAPRPSQHPNPCILAVTIALLWLSNAPAAVMGCYTVAALALLRLAAMLVAHMRPKNAPHRKLQTGLQTRSNADLKSELQTGAHAAADRDLRNALRFVTRTTVGTLLGFALAAYFLLPAIAERPWVQLSMAILPGMRPADNTLFHHTGDAAHDTVLHTASLLSLLLFATLALSLASIAFRRRQLTNPANPAVELSHSPLIRPSAHIPPFTVALLAALGALLALMLTRVALPLWNHAPDLAFLQFPWRLLSVAAAVIALCLALALRNLHLRPIPTAALGLALAAILTTAAYRAFNQPCDLEDAPAARLAAFTSPTAQARGSDPTDEYTPVTADNDSLQQNNPPYRLLPPDRPVDTPPPADAISGPAPHTLDVALASPMVLVLNLRDYPTWQITRDGVPVTEHLARTDGLLTIALPAGPSHLRITSQATTPERAGAIISLAALAILLALWLRGRMPHRRPTASSLQPRL